MTLIPVATRFESSARGRTAKFVTCEYCMTDYVYLVERKTTGVAFAPFMMNSGFDKVAQLDALTKLETALSQAVDGVPCPRCAKFQSEMVRRARHLHHNWMRVVSCISGTLLACLLAGICNDYNIYASSTHRQFPDRSYVPFLPWSVLVIAIVSSVAIAIMLWRTRNRLAQRYDPNTLPLSQRQALATSRALLRGQYDDLLLRHGATDDNRHSQVDQIHDVRARIGGMTQEMFHDIEQHAVDFLTPDQLLSKLRIDAQVADIAQALESGDANRRELALKELDSLPEPIRDDLRREFGL